MRHKQLGHEEALPSPDQAGCAAMTAQETSGLACLPPFQTRNICKAQALEHCICMTSLMHIDYRKPQNAIPQPPSANPNPTAPPINHMPLHPLLIIPHSPYARRGAVSR